MTTVNHQLVEIALARTDTASFEKFVQSFFSALSGISFVPLGGHHDGGADALNEPGVYEGEKVEHFWQASIEEDYRSKIRRTVRRLREFGRKPSQLTYCTSRIVPQIDKEEDLLSEELGLRVRIRDQKYIVSQINHSQQSVQAFNSYLAPHLAFLREIGGATTVSYSAELPIRSLCVFLSQEVERRRGNTELLEAVTDSLILWALEGTDPDKDVFRSREQILERITAALPAARQFIKGVLDNRLEALADKRNTNGREVRWHRKQDLFCLPYESRLLIEQENTEDETLKASVSDIFALRAAAILKDGNEAALIPKIVATAHRSLEITFEKQGLEVSQFVLGNETEEVHSIADHVDQAIEESALKDDERAIIKEAVLSVLRLAFYKSEEAERTYLSKLSRTYTLLFILKNEPHVVEYFRKMSGNFVLYLGSDLIIRALSEHNLSDQDRMTWNMFKILQAAGATLVLTEKTLEEIISHIRAADHEFRHHYADMEPYIDVVLARHIDRILIRAYFYSRFDEESKTKPASWARFIGLFCTYSELHNAAGKESLRRYLCEEFGLIFETRQETMKNVDLEQLDGLKDKIVDIRSRGRRQKEREEILAYNDALQVLRVYQKRRELGEASKPNPYGYRTWWLTQETFVRKATPEIVRQNNNALYMMRPEFVLNFIALAPSAEEIRKSYGTIFPSLLGVRLSNRLKEGAFAKVIESIREASRIGDARARALASELSDRLKGDQFKRYEVEFEGTKRE